MSPSAPPSGEEGTVGEPEAPGARGYVQSLVARGLSPDKRMFDLLTVIDLSRELLLSWQPDRMLSIYLLSCMGRLGSAAGAVLLLDERSQEEFTVASLRGTPKEMYAELRVAVGSRLENRLAVGMRPIAAVDAIPLLRPAERARWKALDLSLAIPMLTGDRMKGITLLGRRVTEQPYGPDEMEFVTYVANLTILAVERSRASHRYEDRAMELEVASRLYERQVEDIRRRFEDAISGRSSGGRSGQGPGTG